MKKIYLIIAIVTIILLLGSCASPTAPTPTKPSVTLLSPNGGETFKSGEFGLIDDLGHRLMIRWRVNGIFDENAYVVVKIRKGKEPAEVLFAEPISPPWDSLEHSWSPYSIPERFEPGNDYKIEIVPVLSEKKDEWNIEMEEIVIGNGDTSDGYFTIQKSTPLISSVTVATSGRTEILNHSFTITVEPIEVQITNVGNLLIQPDESVALTYMITNHSKLNDHNLVAEQTTGIKSDWYIQDTQYLPGTPFIIERGQKMILKITFYPESEGEIPVEISIYRLSSTEKG